MTIPLRSYDSLKTYASGVIVVDPFSGSGTTIVAIIGDPPYVKPSDYGYVNDLLSH